MLRILRAARRGFQGGAAEILGDAVAVHFAQMSAVTSTTCRQGALIGRRESDQERHCSEEEHKQDGKGAPHP